MTISTKEFLIKLGKVMKISQKESEILLHKIKYCLEKGMDDEWMEGYLIQEIDSLTIPKNSNTNIAVISLDSNDFLSWENQRNLIRDRVGTIKNFNSNGVTYHCISNITDLCSLTLNNYFITDHGFLNEQFEAILLEIKKLINLKQ